jgi:hypothetical protein
MNAECELRKQAGLFQSAFRIPQSMKAVVFHEHGGPEVLRYEERPEPTIRANEVLIEVRACALNHLDVWARAGLPGIAAAYFGERHRWNSARDGRRG